MSFPSLWWFVGILWHFLAYRCSTSKLCLYMPSPGISLSSLVSLLQDTNYPQLGPTLFQHDLILTHYIGKDLILKKVTFLDTEG
jgi:hypothetical protein